MKWLFFDVGGVLLDDDPVMAAVFRHIWQSVQKKGRRISFKDLMSEREQLSARGPRLRIHHELALKYLTMEEWKLTRRRYLDETIPVLEQICPPIPGMKSVVRKIRPRVHLGLIANQPDDIIPVLEKHNYWKLFEVKGISEVVGLSKPDPDFYRWAIRAAGCLAKDAVMIGDTVKYDIRPAQRVGMRTIWFNLSPREKGYQPRDEFEEMYIESLMRQLESRRESVRRKVRPDAIAYDSKELQQVLEKILNGRYGGKTPQPV